MEETMDISFSDDINDDDDACFLGNTNGSFSSMGSTGSSNSFSMLEPPALGFQSSIVNKWNAAATGSPSRTKLRSEYHQRIKSPSKRRMSLESTISSESSSSFYSSSSKRSNSPVVLHRR